MFQCNQDTSLLCHAVVSAAKNSNGCLQCVSVSLKDKLLSVISRSLKTVIGRHIACQCESSDRLKGLEANIHINQRLHAAVFFNTLRSYDITSDSADLFYGSVSIGWPSIDFEFYVELNHRQDWSEHFIKCASQLPDKILVIVLKCILNISLSSHIKYYLWHLIVQALLHKLMKIPADGNPDCSFKFDFECKTSSSLYEDFATNDKLSLSSNGLEEESTFQVRDMFDLIYNEIQSEVKASNDIKFIKLLLHAAKTLMKYKHSHCNKDILNIYKILDDCLRIDANVVRLTEFINNYKLLQVMSEYITTAWGIPENYLVLILNYYYFSLLPEEILNLKNILECSEIPYFFPVILREISPFLRKNFHEQNVLHLKLLFQIIEYKFEGARYAAEVLFSNPLLLEQDQAITVLEENSCVIDCKNVYPLFLECILAVNNQELKVRLLKLFYSILSTNTATLYNDVLKYVLLTYGITEIFQLPDYEEQLSVLVQRTSVAKDTENVLLTLFVQSPKETLKCIIEEALVQGKDGKALIQVLKLIPEACIFFKVDSDTTPLIKILLNYIQKDKLEEYECKNFSVLFELLMEVHLETEILDVDLFIKKCCIPYMKQSDKLQLILPCLRIVIQQLSSRENILKKETPEDLEVQNKWKCSVSPESMKKLVYSVGLLIDSAVELGCGRSKDFYVTILNALERYQIVTEVLSNYDKKELEVLLLPLNEVVLVYTKEFLSFTPEFKNLSTLWIWCCKVSDFSMVEKKFSEETLSYPDFLNALVQLVPHLTAEEWKISFTFSENLKKYSYFIKKITLFCSVPFKFSDSDLSTYAVISSYITSLHFTLPAKVNESLYTSSCFINVLVKKIKEEVKLSTQLVLTIFLDLCFLISCLEPDLMKLFSSVLFELRDCLSSCVDLSGDCHLKELMSASLKCLPDSTEKSALLQKMGIF